MRKSKLMKALLVFGMSVVTATSMVGIAACNNNPGDGGDDNGNGNGHQHSYDGWNISPTQHWHECLECSEEADRGDHKDLKNNKTGADGKDNYCDDCGYELAHTYADTWSKDPDGHWHQAVCEHTTEIDELKPHVDNGEATGSTANDAVCDVCGYVGETSQGYKDFVANKLTEKATKVLDETFFVAKELPLFDKWGAAGLYASDNSETHKVTVSGGKANLITPASNPATCLYVDFGDAAGTTVEGSFRISNVTGSNSYTAVQFTTSDGTNDSELFGLRTNKGNAIKYRLNGGGSDIEVAGAPAWSSGATDEGNISVYYKYNTATNKITLTINNTAFVTDLQLNGTMLKGIKFSSGSGNADTYSVDDIIVIKTPVDLTEYKTAIQNNAAAEKAKVTAAGFNVDSVISSAEQALASAAESATTTVELTEAYNTYFAALLNAYGDAVKNKISSDYPATDYDDAANEDAADYTAAVNKLAADVTAAKTVENITAAYKTADGALKELHNDTWWNKADVVVTVVNGKDGANTLTVKEGDEVTKAQLDALVEVPANKKIGGYYTDSECTDANAVTLPLTVNSATSIYVKLVEKTTTPYKLNIKDIAGTAVTTETQVGQSIFYINNKVKSENGNKMAVVEGTATYEKQVSLTGGAVSTTANAIKFTVSGTTEVTVVAGQKSDKNTSLKVLDSEGNAVTVSGLKINNETATAFDVLPKATANTVMPNTYTFTLAAGTYYLGGAGGGAYIYELSLEVEN